jgi:hypothetical protein
MAGQTACPEESLARARKRCDGGRGFAGCSEGGEYRGRNLRFEMSDLKFEISELRFEQVGSEFELKKEKDFLGRKSHLETKEER